MTAIENTIALTPAELRRRAEAQLALRPKPPAAEADTQRLVHELQVHQIELEMQNEALRQTQAETLDALQQVTHLKEHLEEKVAARTAELVMERQRLELAIAGADLAVWDWNIPSDALTVNPRWTLLLGTRPPAGMGAWHAFIHPDDLAECRAALDIHLRAESPRYEIEQRLRHGDGHWVWVLCRGKVVERDGTGYALRMAGTLLDISGIKRLEGEKTQLLQRIESMIQGVAKQAPNEAPSTPAPSPSPETDRKRKLSPRQLEVLQRVSRGLTSAEIARELYISEATVVVHRRDIMGKLDLHSVAELTRYALDHNLPLA